jgi:TRAP-type C4-dicarboxylate transport system permease large subunit
MEIVFALALRRLGWSDFRTAVTNAARTSMMIFMIIIGAGVFGTALTLSGVTLALLAYVLDAGLNRWVILLTVVLIWLFLGFFLEQFAIQVLTVPVAVPLLMQLGFDPIWLGVLLVKAGEIGIVTPPMGLNVFVVSSVTRVPVNTVFRGVWPFVAAELVLLGVLIAWPGLSLWLANYAS